MRVLPLGRNGSDTPMLSHGVAWQVEPAQRVGSFVLGMGVNEALAEVQKMGSLETAELSFDEQRLFVTDVSLRLPTLGLQLCFDGFQQDLRVISVLLQPTESDAEQAPADDQIMFVTESAASPGSALPALVYGGQTFAGAGQPALALRDVYNMFGPTWIGDFRTSNPSNCDAAAYFLRYPGLTFEFSLPEELVESLAARDEHPMELPGYSAPTAARMWIYSQHSRSLYSSVSVLPELPEPIIVHPAFGVVLRGRMLRFGAMPQDVFSDFGPPEQVCVKDVDAVRIHSAKSLPSKFSGSDYYYNYFHLGIDVLFDGRSHLVKKVILHTNPPTHELFSRYARCFFELSVRDGDASKTPVVHSAVPQETAEGETASAPPQPPAAAEEGVNAVEPCFADSAGKDQDIMAMTESNEGGDASDQLARKASKKERKSQKKKNKPVKPLAPTAPESSPEPTPEASPEATPDLAALPAPAASPSQVSDDQVPPIGLDALPPPAVPIEAGTADLANKLEPLPSGTINIGVQWPWADIQDVLSRKGGCNCGKPLVMSQRTYTPFGSTYFYALPGVAFEVMQNGFLASLTVFSVPRDEIPAVFVT